MQFMPNSWMMIYLINLMIYFLMYIINYFNNNKK